MLHERIVTARRRGVSCASTAVASWYAASGFGSAARPERLAEAIDGRRPRVRLLAMGLNDDYTSGSYRSLILMVVGIILVIALIWLAYGWALGVPGAPTAPG